MKSKKALISLLATASLAALFSASSVTATAADNSNSTAIAKFDKVITIKNIPRLSKWGYIVTVNSDSQPISVGKDSYQKMLNDSEFKNKATISPKKVKNVKFKVVKIAYAKHHNGALMYLITSKDNKYSTWTTNPGMQYYAFKSKTLQGVVKPLNRISKRATYKWQKISKKARATRIRKNEYDFNLAVKAAKKLKGQQRKFVLASLKQAKKDGYITELTLPLAFNILLWGIDQ
ncbi:hypothetical protein [Lactobacillus gallinarum]|uniref:Uncharacterized protein n=1 Tax=Lactobacillus crispatus TaxID=47770 RepID=A0A921FJQ5_9LACO|nr:hypothetical protein [Lactobacillus gallinarum]HJF09974.1 hypothetical protein [Lactobacillus crispatus]